MMDEVSICKQMYMELGDSFHFSTLLKQIVYNDII